MAILAILFFGGVVPLVSLFGLQFWPTLLGVMSVALVVLVVMIAMRLRTGREGKLRWCRLGLFVVGTLGLSLLSLWLSGATAGGALRASLVERIRGETPEARIEAYVDAVLRGDGAAALAVWKVPAEDGADEQSNLLHRRRQEVTCTLIAADLDSEYMITRTEWWRTCCEPGVTCDPRNAGGARVRVQFLDQDGLPVTYVFDVFHQDGAYWGLRRAIHQDGGRSATSTLGARSPSTGDGSIHPAWNTWTGRPALQQRCRESGGRSG
jgi:hypothetical protein